MAEQQISAALVRELRETTGSPLMDCKKALVEAGGDIGKAQEVLRLKGIKTADKKSTRDTKEGLVGFYRHHDGKKAVLVEVNCESDFVARNETFQEFTSDVAMHVMAMRPDYVHRDEVPEDVRKKEEEMILASDELQSKPEAARSKIVEGRLRKFFESCCLLDQRFVKDESKTIEQYLKETVSSVGENIKVSRFVLVEVGG